VLSFLCSLSLSLLLFSTPKRLPTPLPLRYLPISCDLAALLRFGLGSYRPSLVVDPARRYATVEVGWGRDAVPVVAPRRIVRPAPLGRALAEQVVVSAVAALPVAAGQRLGTLVVRDGTRVVARSPLVAAEARDEPGTLAKAGWLARRTGHNLVGLLTP